MTVYLNHLGIKAERVPENMIKAKGDHLYASYDSSNITELRKFAFRNNDSVKVVGGFYGVDENNITKTFGFGGGDTTQMGTAKDLAAKICYNITDVPGVYAITPKLLTPEERKNMKSISLLSFPLAMELAYNQIQVLHPTCLGLVADENIPVYIFSLADPDGTYTKIQGKSINKDGIIGVAGHYDNIYVHSLIAGDLFGGKGTFAEFADAYLNNDVQVVTGGAISMMASAPCTIEEAGRIYAQLVKHGGEVRSNNGLSVLAVIAEDIHRKPGIVRSLFELFEKHNISYTQMSSDNLTNGISFTMDSETQRRASLAIYRERILPNQKR